MQSDVLIDFLIIIWIAAALKCPMGISTIAYLLAVKGYACLAQSIQHSRFYIIIIIHQLDLTNYEFSSFPS